MLEYHEIQHMGLKFLHLKLKIRVEGKQRREDGGKERRKLVQEGTSECVSRSCSGVPSL